MKRRPPSLDKPYPRHRPLSDDEKALWRSEMGESRNQEPETGIQEESLPPLNPRAEGARDSAKKPQATPKTHAITHLDKPTLAKIRRGGVAIEATLDLHGHNRHQAHTALLNFVAQARARGLRLVLIVTGKGKEGRGTLRGELPRWLNESPLREAIISYDVAGPRHGGQGAWYVRIRRQKPEVR